jgi:hypothetical protein
LQRPVVFISYSHDSDEHREKVWGLAARLRQDGLDARLDQQVNGTPEQGWPRWMLDQLDKADFVLVVCTPTYYRRFRGHDQPGRGKGADWEGALITQEIYDAKSRTVKFVPVLLSAGQRSSIPEPLRAHTHYELTSDERYHALFAFLLGQAGVELGPIGDHKPFSKPIAQPLTFGPKPEAPPPSPIQATMLGVPPRNPYFKGRDKLLQRLHQKLQAAEVGPQSPLFIYGAAGVGKSQAIVEYVHQFGAHYRFILWVETESEDSLRLTYRMAATSLGLIATPAEFEPVVQAVKRWLSGEYRWLLVFDGAKDIKTIRKYLPLTGSGKVLITSQRFLPENRFPVEPGLFLEVSFVVNYYMSKRLKKKIPHIEVEALEPEDAVSFIAERTGKLGVDAAALTGELEYIPYALEQAAACIKAMGIGITEYIAKYRRAGIAIGAQGLSLYGKSNETSLALNLAALREVSPASADLLILASFLPPGSNSIAGFLHAGLRLSHLLPALEQVAKDLLVFENLFDALERHSLVERLPDHSFRLHRLTKELVQRSLPEKERSALAVMVTNALGERLLPPPA